MFTQDTNGIKRIYMLGIGGIAMGTLATMLRERGYEVAGSDQNLYPPMSTHLENLRMPLFRGYDAANLDLFPADLYIIGNVIRRENPEAIRIMEESLPYASMPEAIARLFLRDHQSMVVAGTHGKSTTSSLLAWVLAHGGLDPSAFIGAFVKNWGASYRLGEGRYMVLEGDEYDTAFFDKGAKFLHYRPHIGMLTSIEFDHADIFADFDAVRRAFERYVALIEPDGVLIVNADDPHCLALSKSCRGRIILYGRTEEAHWRLRKVIPQDGALAFTYTSPMQPAPAVMRSPLPGAHNASNTLAVMAAASLAGLSMDAVQEALLAFQGVKRRQDVVGECGGVLVMDDFAHHPTAVAETIRAVRLFYPNRRIISAFEPRTNSSRRSVFQDAYAASFDEAHLTCIKVPPGLETIPEAQRLNSSRLVDDIRARGQDAHLFATADDLIAFLLEVTREGDLILCMSNGSFDGVPQRLIEALQDRNAAQWNTLPELHPRGLES